MARAKTDLRRCLENWDKGDNGILNYSKAYRLQPGTGWLVPPDILHAPGSLVTYEPQWGSRFGPNRGLGRVPPLYRVGLLDLGACACRSAGGRK